MIFKNYTILTTNLNNLYIKYYTNVGFLYFKTVNYEHLRHRMNFPSFFPIVCPNRIASRK